LLGSNPYDRAARQVAAHGSVGILPVRALNSAKCLRFLFTGRFAGDEAHRFRI